MIVHFIASDVCLLFDVFQFSTTIGSGSLTLLNAFEAAFASCDSFVNDLFSDVRIKTLPIQLYFTSKEIVCYILDFPTTQLIELFKLWICHANY